jgi:hypothetical protein
VGFLSVRQIGLSHQGLRRVFIGGDGTREKTDREYKQTTVHTLISFPDNDADCRARRSA